MSRPGPSDRPDGSGPDAHADRRSDVGYPPGTVELLTSAWHAVAEASYAETPEERYVAAHLGALRAAAAVLAARARPSARSSARSGPTVLDGAAPRPTPPGGSAWTLLAGVAPELREWSDFFAVSSRVVRVLQRPDAPSGRHRSGLTERQADDLVRDAERFVADVRALLRSTRPRRDRDEG